jgi:hypothetical protein
LPAVELGETDPQRAGVTVECMNKPIADRYVSQINWLVSQGREDLIDPIADEYEAHLDRWRAESASADHETEQAA